MEVYAQAEGDDVERARVGIQAMIKAHAKHQGGIEPVQKVARKYPVALAQHMCYGCNTRCFGLISRYWTMSKKIWSHRIRDLHVTGRDRKPQDGDLVVQVDWDRLAQEMAAQAARNRSGRAVRGGGLITATWVQRS